MSDEGLGPYNGHIPDRAVKVEDNLYAIYRFDPFGELDHIEYSDKKPDSMESMDQETFDHLIDGFEKAKSEWEQAEQWAMGEIYSEKSEDAAHFWMNVIDQDSRRIYLRNAFSKWNPKWENTEWQKLPRYVRQILSKYMNERQGKTNRVRIKRPHNASATVRRRRNRRWPTKSFSERLKDILKPKKT